MNCLSCNKDFKPHNRLQKYCDSSCRNKANYKKHKRISRGDLIAWIRANQEDGLGCGDIEVVNTEKLLEFLGE